MIRSHIQDDVIVALGVEGDEANARVALRRPAQIFRAHAFLLIQVHGNVAKNISADNGDQVTLRAQAGRAHRLIGAFAARPHIEIGADEGLALHRETRRAQREADGETADDGDPGTTSAHSFSSLSSLSSLNSSN